MAVIVRYYIRLNTYIRKPQGRSCLSGREEKSSRIQSLEEESKTHLYPLDTTVRAAVVASE